MRTFLVAVLAFALGAGVMYFASDPSGSRAPVRRDSDAAPQSSQVAAVGELTRDLEAAKQREQALQTTIRELRAAAGEQTAAASAGEGVRGTGAAQRDPKRPRFVYAETEKSLKALNWEETGKAAAELMPLLSEAAAISKGEKQMRPEFYGEIMKSVGPLVTVAIKLESEDVSWFHPSVAVNMIHATLLQAGKPLNEQQQQDLDKIGLRFVERDGQRRGGYGDQTLELKAMLDEVAVQEQLFTEVRTLLDDAQRGVLYPPGVSGTVNLDVFSGPHMFNDKCEALPHTTRENLRGVMHARLVKEFELRPELSEPLAALVRSWAEGFSDEFLSVKPTPAQQYEADGISSKRALFLATRQLALFESMLATLPLNDKERRRVREQDELFVLMLRE